MRWRSLPVPVFVFWELTTMPERRFPPPWSVEDIGAAYVVKDGAFGMMRQVPATKYDASLLRIASAATFTAWSSALSWARSAVKRCCGPGIS